MSDPMRLAKSWERDLRAAGLSASTVEHNTRDVRGVLKFIGKAEIEAITVDDLRDWQDAYAGTHSTKTTRNAVGAVRQFLEWCVAEGEISGSPGKNLKLPKHLAKPMPAYSIDDVERLLAQCNLRSKEGVRDYAIVLMLIDSGVRVGELVSMVYPDVEDDKMQMVQVKGKTGYRDVPLSVSTAQALDRYLRRWGIPQQYRVYEITSTDGGRPQARPTDDVRADLPIWRNLKGAKPLTVSGIEQLIRRLCKYAGVKYLGVHAFRRASAILAKLNGAQDSDILENFGWRTLTMLRHYTGSDAKRLARQAHQRYSPANALLARRPTDDPFKAGPVEGR